MRHLSLLFIVLLSLSIFCFTLLPPRHDAFSVLYVIVIFLVSQAASRHVIKLIACLCIGLSVFSFSLVHRDDIVHGPYTRLALSIFAILLVTLLVLRNQRITEALAKQKRILAHADRMLTLGYLSASIAHEINQPLTAIRTYAHSGARWLKKTEPDLIEALHCFGSIEKNSQRAESIIGNIKNLAQKKAGIPEQISVHQIIQESCDILKNEIRNKKINVIFNPSGQDIQFCAVRIEIQQILINILMNAIQAFKESIPNNFIHIRVYDMIDRENFFAIHVVDNAMGFIEATPENIFDAFFSTKQNGMGLGLTICKGIIEAHGGRLIAEHNKPKGAKFIIQLPKYVP